MGNIGSEIRSGVVNGAGRVQGRLNGGTLSISEMDYGVSANGAGTYVDGINMIAIGNAIKTLQDTSKVKKALEDGWQGAAEMAFERKLDTAVDMVVDALELIKDKIEGCVSQLVEDMANQDEHMLDDLEDFGIARGSSSAITSRSTGIQQ